MTGSEKRRPIFFNLMQIQMPVGALTSITHRVTGIFLAISVPFGIYLLDLSLQGPQSYAHLLSDIDIGSQLPAARRSAWAVNLGGIAVALLALGALL